MRHKWVKCLSGVKLISCLECIQYAHFTTSLNDNQDRHTSKFCSQKQHFLFFNHFSETLLSAPVSCVFTPERCLKSITSADLCRMQTRTALFFLINSKGGGVFFIYSKLTTASTIFSFAIAEQNSRTSLVVSTIHADRNV